MDLLPQTHQEFSSAEYWDSFFKKRGKESFEWYGEYNELSGILHKYIKTKDRTLVVGCGSSRLSEDLYDLGYHSLVNIDISDVVINQMKARSESRRPQLVYEKMDVFKMSYEDNQYSVVLDKGTLDALLPDGDEKNTREISRMFDEISRVLRIGGRYICISLAQKHIVDTVLKFFSERGWMSRVHCLLRAASGQDVFPLPVFAFIFTKFKQIPGSSPILEFSVGEDGKAERYSTVEEISKMIEQSQNYSLIRDNLHKRLHPGEQIQLDLHTPGGSSLRYRLTVVDRKKNKDRNRKFAIFIVPHGREIEWMFSTDAGRLQLAESAGFQRLVVVGLHRGQSYGSLGMIQDELSAKVMDLAPHDLDSSVKVPFLSAGTDIGTRTILFEGESPVYGRLVVEDVAPGDGTSHRRLICLSNESFVQSEVRLRQGGNRGNKKKSKQKSGGDLILDYSALSLDQQNQLLAGLMMVEDVLAKINSGLIRVLVIGLAGCTLPVFLHRQYKKVHIDVLESDDVMVTVAKEWFGLETDGQLNVYHSDHRQYVENVPQQADGAKYDAVILNPTADAQSKACSDREFLLKLKGVMTPTDFPLHIQWLSDFDTWCPLTNPDHEVTGGKLFFASNFLPVTEPGVLILGHTYQDQDVLSKVTTDIKDCFNLISVASNEKTLSAVVYALCSAPSGENDRQSLLELWRTNAEGMRKLSEKNTPTCDLDLSDYLEDLDIS